MALFAVSIATYFLGGGLFKGELTLQEPDMEALQKCVTGIPETGLTPDNIYNLEIKDGCEVQIASTDEQKAKVYYIKFTAQKNANDPMGFDFSGESNLDDSIKPTFSWSFGDNTQTESFQKGTKITHKYEKTGDYTVKLTASANWPNNKTYAFEATKKITILAKPALTIKSGGTNELIIFDSSPDITNVHLAIFSCGKGDNITFTTDPNKATESMPLITAITQTGFDCKYDTTDTKTYTLKYTYYDKNGEELSSVSQEETMPFTNTSASTPDKNVEEIPADALVYDIQCMKIPTNNLEVSCTTKNFSKKDNVSIGDLIWNFGDEKNEKGTKNEDGSIQSILHTYNQKGTYKVSLTLYSKITSSDDKSLSKAFTKEIDVTVSAAKVILEEADMASATLIASDKPVASLDLAELEFAALNADAAITEVDLQVTATDPAKLADINSIQLIANGQPQSNKVSMTSDGKIVMATSKPIPILKGQNIVLKISADFNSITAGGQYKIVVQGIKFADPTTVFDQKSVQNLIIEKTGLVPTATSNSSNATHNESSTKSLSIGTITVPPEASFTVGTIPSPNTDGKVVVLFTDNSKSPNLIQKCAWDFGDSASNVNKVEITPSCTYSHTYSAQSTEQLYTVTMTITDKKGHVYTPATQQITIPATQLNSVSFNTNINNALFTDVINTTATSAGAGLADTFTANASGDFANSITVKPGDAVAIVTYNYTEAGDATNVVKIKFDSKEWSLDIHKAAVGGAQDQGKDTSIDQNESKAACENGNPVTDLQEMATVLVKNGNLSTYLKNDENYQAMLDGIKKVIDEAIASNTKVLDFLDKYKNLLTSKEFGEALEIIGIKPITKAQINEQQDTLKKNNENLYANKKTTQNIDTMLNNTTNKIFADAVGFDASKLEKETCKTNLEALTLTYDASQKTLTLDLSKVHKGCLKDAKSTSVKIEMEQKNDCSYVPSAFKILKQESNLTKQLDAGTAEQKDLIAKLSEHLDSFDKADTCKFSADTINFIKNNIKDSKFPGVYAQSLDVIQGADLEISKIYTDDPVTTIVKAGINEDGKPLHGTTKEDGAGKVTYTADSDYIGQDRVIYTLQSKGDNYYISNKSLFNRMIIALFGIKVDPVASNGEEDSKIQLKDAEGISLTCINVKAKEQQVQNITTDNGAATGGTTNVYNTYNTYTTGGTDTETTTNTDTTDNTQTVSRFVTNPDVKTGAVTIDDILKLDSASCLQKGAAIDFKDTDDSTLKVLSSIIYDNKALVEGYRQNDGSRAYQSALPLKRSEGYKLAAFVTCTPVDLPISPTESFQDESLQDWHYYIVNSGKILKILDGFEGGKYFKPEQYMTRAEFAKMISSIAKIDHADASCAKRAADVSQDSWFYEPSHDMLCNNLLAGTLVNGKIYMRPDAQITRGEAAVFVYNYFVHEAEKNL